MAIIVAGAVGKGRDEAIHRLIKLVQADYAADHLERYRRMAEHETATQEPEQESRKRRHTAGPQSIHYAANAVSELFPPPTSNAYRTTHHPQPFIIRRFANPSTSPAISHWRSAAYLLSLVGPGRVVPVEIGTSYTAIEWGQRIVPFELFLSRIGYDVSGLQGADLDGTGKADELPRGQPLYLAQHALLDQFPMLRPDVGPLPDYIYAEPGAEGYAPPGNEQGLILNVWVGNGAGAGHGEEPDKRKGIDSAGPVISPAHTVRSSASAVLIETLIPCPQDPYYNCYLQILGEKRVWIAPPDVSDSMYAFPEPEAQDSNSELDDAEGDSDISSTASGFVTSYTTNTSRVPIFENPDRSRGPGYERRYEQFYERAFPQSLEAVLEPGDLLVMPPKWSVVSLTSSWSSADCLYTGGMRCGAKGMAWLGACPCGTNRLTSQTWTIVIGISYYDIQLVMPQPVLIKHQAHPLRWARQHILHDRAHHAHARLRAPPLPPPAWPLSFPPSSRSQSRRRCPAYHRVRHGPRPYDPPRYHRRAVVADDPARFEGSPRGPQLHAMPSRCVQSARVLAPIGLGCAVIETVGHP